MMKIPSSEISVVFQGPLIHKNTNSIKSSESTLANLMSIESLLPDAEIIVSTWSNENTDGIKNHQIIRSEKPHVICDLNGNKNNINLQIHLTKAGILASSRPYILKIRSDFFLNTDSFFNIDSYENSSELSDRLFSSPVNITNIFTRDPTKTPMLFHLSDTVHFGRREDIMDLWSHPLFEEAELLQPGGPIKNPIGNFAGFTSMRMVPEQALTLAWLRRHNFDVELAHICDVSFQKFKLWEKLLFTNFRIFPWQQSGITYPDRFIRSNYTENLIYNVTTIDQIKASLPNPPHRIRYLKVLLNKYLFFLFHRIWYVIPTAIITDLYGPNCAFRLM